MTRDIKTIGRHVNNAFNEGELDKMATVANFATVQIEGEREVTRQVEHYNLDVIISVGYRVKSQKGARSATAAVESLDSSYTVENHDLSYRPVSPFRLG